MSAVERRAVVIGGSSGIGLATARLARNRGCAVTIVSRNPERADIDADKVSLDITDTARLRSFFHKAGPIDYLVCTSTHHVTAPFRDIDLAAARKAFEVKFWGALEAIQASDVREAIVLVTGISAAVPWRNGQSTIAAAVCGAAEAAARSLAIGLAPIRVNAVAPGTIDTPLFSKMAPEARMELFAHTADVLPGRRVGKAAEVAEAIWLLLTNAFMTGEVLYVDGGHRLVAP